MTLKFILVFSLLICTVFPALGGEYYLSISALFYENYFLSLGFINTTRGFHVKIPSMHPMYFEQVHSSVIFL
jgi:hypothetical protein